MPGTGEGMMRPDILFMLSLLAGVGTVLLWLVMHLL